MLDKVRSSDTLLPVRVVQRSDGGADVWLRKNIEGPLTEVDSVEGFSSTYFSADEAFIRLAETVCQEDVEADFDGYWARAVAYDPQAGPGKRTIDQRVTVLEEDSASFSEQLDILLSGATEEAAENE